mgnify:CR=1 FL=1
MSQLRIQDARAVAYRALCLGALLQRAELELSLQDVDEWSVFDEVRQHFIKKQESKIQKLSQWLIDEHIAPHLSETEQYLMGKPAGKWSERNLISVGWRTEALGTMLWVLNRIDYLPGYDNQFDPDDLLVPLDIFQPTIDFIWMARLRPDYELTQERDRAELWNWRSRARELKRMGVRPPEGVTFNEIIRLTAEDAYQKGHIDVPISGDFPVLNKSYAHLTADEYAILSAIAYERNSALSWVCEITSEWESIRID